MKIKFFNLLFAKKKILFALVIGLFIADWGYRLRAYQFAAYPPITDTCDEFKYAFNGLSLLKTGTPESWSYYENYGKFPMQSIRNVNYRLVKPYFDDPPLFGLISGLFARWRGMDTYEKVEAGSLRWPMLKIGALNVFLLYLLVFWLSGFWPAVLTGLIYAVQPTFVISSRLPLAENMITFWLLLALLLLKAYLTHPSRWFLYPLALLCGGGVLLKSTAVFLPAAVGFIFWAKKKPKETLLIAAFTFFFIFLWFAYGYYYGWTLFKTLLGRFSGRELWFPFQIAKIFTVPRIAESAIRPDYWLIWGWFSLFVFGLFGRRWRNKKESWLYFISATGAHLVLFMIMSGHDKGWYRYPFYPLLAWSMAEVFLYLFRHPRFLGILFWFALPLSEAYVTGRGRVGWSIEETRWFQRFFPLLMSLPLLSDLTHRPVFRFLSRSLLAISFFLLIFWASKTILFFSDEFWYR